jgi:glutaredoxin
MFKVSSNKLKLIIFLLGFLATFSIFIWNKKANAQTESISAQIKEIINKEKNINICLGPGEAAIYFFYSQECQHCAKEEKFLETLAHNNKKIKIYRYEVSHNKENARLLNKIGKELNINTRGVPLTIAGEKIISGYYDDAITGAQILAAIEENCKANEQKIEKINIPFFKEINIKKLSLPVITVIIAALDGFNPCALWILLFLISILVAMRDRKKILILGGTFILTSAVFYFFVLTAWLNFLLFVGLISWLRIIIGAVAIYAGYYNLKKFFLNKNKGCEAVNEEKRKKTFTKIREILAREKILFAFLGIIILALSVNLLELVCSAGLPAVYIQILAITDLTKWQYYLYLFLYVFIFILNEIIIFSLALFSLQLKTVSPKIMRLIGLLGGIIMLILGILLLLKPSWLMWQ